MHDGRTDTTNNYKSLSENREENYFRGETILNGNTVVLWIGPRPKQENDVRDSIRGRICFEQVSDALV